MENVCMRKVAGWQLDVFYKQQDKKKNEDKLCTSTFTPSTTPGSFLTFLLI